MEEDIICSKANLITLKRDKQSTLDNYNREQENLEKNIQELQLKIANLKNEERSELHEDWEPMTDLQVDRWIEAEIEKE